MTAKFNNDPHKDIATFDRPPLNEVVMGIGFDPIQGFSIVEAGRFWGEVSDEYPDSESAPPIPVPGIMPSIQVTTMPTGRIILKNPGRTKILQIQDSWFFCNWVKASEDHEYPRYSSVYKSFKSSLDKFLNYLDHRQRARPTVVNQTRLTYVNYIPKSGWRTPDEVSRFLPDLFSNWSQHKFIPSLKNFSLKCTTTFEQGDLDVSVQNGMIPGKLEEMIVFELTFFSPHQRELSSLDSWFSIARSIIVKSFIDLTSDLAHEKWGLRQND